MSVPSRRAELAWRAAIALAAALAATAAASGCSASQCKDMKGSGSPFAGLLCGGAGDDAPEAQSTDGGAAVADCRSPRQVMPQFFKLLDDPTRPLDGLRAAVAAIGAPVCFTPIAQRRCTPGGEPCELGDCVPDAPGASTGLCPCVNASNPLGDLLVVTFRGLATVADPTKPAEPNHGTPSQCGTNVSCLRCTTIANDPALNDSNRNQLCELRRTLDFLLAQNGGAQLFDDPNVVKTLIALLDYVQGKGYDRPHYDLLSTAGKMASNPGICDPHDLYTLLDKMLGYLTPANASKMVGDLKVLLKDPQTQQLLASFTDPNGGSAQGRAAVITLATKLLLPALRDAKNSTDALQPIDNLAQQLVLSPSANYSQSFKTEVKNVLDDVHAMLCDASGTCGAVDTGVFPPLQKELRCIGSDSVDPNGDLVGAIYDLISLKPLNGAPGVDLPTLLGAIQAIAQLDTSGQVVRLLRYVLRSADADDQATEAIRALLADALTPPAAGGNPPIASAVPALSALVQYQVLGEVLSLLQEILITCTPPKT